MGVEAAGAALGALSVLVSQSLAGAVYLSSFLWILLAIAVVDYRTSFIPRRLTHLLIMIGTIKIFWAIYLGKMDGFFGLLSWHVRSGDWGELGSSVLLAIMSKETGWILAPFSGAVLWLMFLVFALWGLATARARGLTTGTHPYEVFGGGDLWLVTGAGFNLALMPTVVATVGAMAAAIFLTVFRRRGRYIRLGPWLASAYAAAALTTIPKTF
jgi:prepilin signal peptidase PulO-like enzyme (type II secretory pathway)